MNFTYIETENFLEKKHISAEVKSFPFSHGTYEVEEINKTLLTH